MMSTSSTSSTSPDTPPMAYQVPVQVPLPTYNWASRDQMWEFHLFKHQLETWTRICKIKAEEKRDYLLCILSKEGYTAMDRWVWADRTHKNDPIEFLHYIESILDDEISPQVCVYQLEDITKRSDESIGELVDQIWPTCLQGTNQQWQWCCNWVWSSMQDYLGDPRSQHQALQTNSKGQLWQEGIAPTRDLQNILHCWIRSGCNVCGSCSTCCMPHLPGTWSNAADVICTVPQLHPSTPSW